MCFSAINGSGSAYLSKLLHAYTPSRTPVSDITGNLSVNHPLFPDDTQLKNLALHRLTNLIKELNACTDDIKTWMAENQLKLNDDKTEALLFPFSSSLKPSTVSLPDSIILISPSLILPGTLDSFLSQSCP